MSWGEDFNKYYNYIFFVDIITIILCRKNTEKTDSSQWSFGNNSWKKWQEPIHKLITFTFLFSPPNIAITIIACTRTSQVPVYPIIHLSTPLPYPLTHPSKIFSSRKSKKKKSPSWCTKDWSQNQFSKRIIKLRSKKLHQSSKKFLDKLSPLSLQKRRIINSYIWLR